MERWVVSDTHFGHESVCTKFKNPDGSPLRDFASAAEMDEVMVERWNALVQPNDVVIHLGDVVINKKKLPILDRLNGIKKLVLGNHDIHHLSALAPYFESMTSMRTEGKDILMTHVPVHEQCIERFGCNVHGHLHEKRITWEVEREWFDMGSDTEIDPRYLNVSCEHTNLAPITIDEVRKRIKEQQEAVGYVPPVAWGNGSGPKE